MFHYCDCPKTNRAKNSQRKHNKGKMAIVEVDSEGICLNCGHYAVASKREHNNISIYKFIFGPVKPINQIKTKERAGSTDSPGRWQDYYDEYTLGSY